jgi:hypothetical protein
MFPDQVSSAFQSADLSQDFTHVGNHHVPSPRVRIRAEEAARPVRFALRSGMGSGALQLGSQPGKVRWSAKD